MTQNYSTNCRKSRQDILFGTLPLSLRKLAAKFKDYKKYFSIVKPQSWIQTTLRSTKKLDGLPLGFTDEGIDLIDRILEADWCVCLCFLWEYRIEYFVYLLTMYDLNLGIKKIKLGQLWKIDDFQIPTFETCIHRNIMIFFSNTCDLMYVIAIGINNHWKCKRFSFFN